MKRLLAISARSVALSWAGFWIYFFIAESLEWQSPLREAALWIGAGILFLLLALIPWRWEKPGALLLIGAGLLIGAAYAMWAPSHLSFDVKVLVTATFAAPPLLAGTLFLMHQRAVTHPAGCPRSRF